MTQWWFDTYRPQDKRRDPIQGEFFSSETISDPGRALVREGIQNSLDAAIGDEPVLVRIFLSGDKHAKPGREVDSFFSGGWRHFHAKANGLIDSPSKDDVCEFLVFEDFYTKGLNGDISEVPRGKEHKNAFAHFFRADGISDKGVGERGSWGVGKTVFQRSSRLNTMFGLTIRSDDRKSLLMGMAVLKGHRVGTDDHKPDGWFGIQGKDGMIMPLDDESVLDQFRKCFSVERGLNPGLSVVVPWLDPEITEDAIVEAVLRDYFYPILTGRLEVIIETPLTKIAVSKNDIGETIEKIGGDLERDLQPLIDLARWSLDQDSAEIPKLNRPDHKKAMVWDEKLIPEELLPHLTKQLQSNERLAVRVPVNVREKNKEAQNSFFDIFLVRDGSDRSDRPVYVRGGLIIPDVRAPRSRGLTSLVIAEDRALAAFLGDSENPSHTQWQHDSSHFKGKYKSGSLDLKFVSHSVRHLMQLLTQSESKEDRNLLADIFHLPDGDLVENGGCNKNRGKETEKPRPKVNKRRKLFNLSPKAGGFSVTASGDAELGDIPPCIEILTAYEVRKGNAFTRYVMDDFNLADAEFRVDVYAAQVLSRSANRILARIENSAFRIEITGFDEKRDVRVRVTPDEDCHADKIV